MQIKEKLEFEKQCMITNKWEYEGTYRPNVYPYGPEERTVNFKQIDRDDYFIHTCGNNFVIRIKEDDGDTKVEIKKMYY